MTIVVVKHGLVKDLNCLALCQLNVESNALTDPYWIRHQDT